jgi:hypothetical protein
MVSEPDFAQPRQDPPPFVTALVVFALFVGGLLFYHVVFGGWL